MPVQVLPAAPDPLAQFPELLSLFTTLKRTKRQGELLDLQIQQQRSALDLFNQTKDAKVLESNLGPDLLKANIAERQSDTKYRDWLISSGKDRHELDQVLGKQAIEAGRLNLNEQQAKTGMAQVMKDEAIQKLINTKEEGKQLVMDTEQKKLALNHLKVTSQLATLGEIAKSGAWEDARQNPALVNDPMLQSIILNRPAIAYMPLTGEGQEAFLNRLALTGDKGIQNLLAEGKASVSATNALRAGATLTKKNEKTGKTEMVTWQEFKKPFADIERELFKGVSSQTSMSTKEGEPAVEESKLAKEEKVAKLQQKIADSQEHVRAVNQHVKFFDEFNRQMATTGGMFSGISEDSPDPAKAFEEKATEPPTFASNGFGAFKAKDVKAMFSAVNQEDASPRQKALMNFMLEKALVSGTPQVVDEAAAKANQHLSPTQQEAWDDIINTYWGS